MTPGVHFKLKLTHAASVWCCVWNPLPDSSVSSLSTPPPPPSPPPTPDSVSPPRWFISPGCVLSTSRPPKGSAVSESPVLSIAWRCSSGAPSSCRTMTISFKVAAPVLYAQVQKNNNTQTHKNLSLFELLLSLSLVFGVAVPVKILFVVAAVE